MRSFALLILAIGIGLLLQLHGPWWLKIVFHPVNLRNAGQLSMLLGALVTAVLLHECGHLLAALVFDFEILGFAFGPLRASHVHGRWSFRLSGQGMGSASVSAIPRKREFWRREMLIVVAAGPLATLLTAAEAVLVLLQFPKGSPAEMFCADVAEICLLLFLLGLIPNGSSSPVRNDASLFLSIWRDTPEARDILLYQLILRSRQEGLRPRHYPARLLQQLKTAGTRPDMRAFFAQTLSLCAWDAGDTDAADVWDRSAVSLFEQCRPELSRDVLAQSACLDVIVRRDTQGAAEKCELLKGGSLRPWLQHRTEAIAAFCAGDFTRARGELLLSERAAKSPLPCYDFERELLCSLRETLPQ